SDDKFSQMLTQLESQPEYGGGSGSGGCGDDEPRDDEDDGEEEEDEDDSPALLPGNVAREDIVMSDSEDSTVTYTAVSSPFGGLSDIGSPGVDGPPVMPEDPYAYVVAAFQAPPSPNFVPGPEYPPSP
ncbi:hypothetical protein Tco_0299486, partial [Tanacetum coccineum]